ncbi:hypothetical protein [Collimonas fungivorans]|uniref:Phasin family protein n=1 Tax=Collimonas fungivorans (strain Ter331) TaxID=1005048 RepID=G0AG66_COLFT|nr:hypothetical protein [Collimonas fungivorans]AEK59957.1 hypothetical protein CFU_0119 [Collimonas fungivorans Ter331]
MQSDFIAQWGKANQDAMGVFFKSLAQAVPAMNQANTGPAAVTADSWKTLVRNHMEQAAGFSADKNAAVNAAWRHRRDQLDFGASAVALQGLADIQINLISRLVESHVQNIRAVTEVSAQYLQNLALTRDGNDIMMALGQCVSGLEAAAKSNAIEGVGIANGIKPALTQWLQASVSEASGGETAAAGQNGNSQETVADVAKKAANPRGGRK